MGKILLTRYINTIHLNARSHHYDSCLKSLLKASEKCQLSPQTIFYLHLAVGRSYQFSQDQQLDSLTHNIIVEGFNIFSCFCTTNTNCLLIQFFAFATFLLTPHLEEEDSSQSLLSPYLKLQYKQMKLNAHCSIRVAYFQ